MFTNPATRRILPPIVQGQTPGAGGNQSPGKNPSSPLTDLLPAFVAVRAYFHSIEVAAGLTLAAGAAWYKLASLSPRNIGQEFSLSGAAATMLPTDSAGGALTGFSNPLAWGDTRGMSAAIVVGRNLPGDVGEWQGFPAFVPGVDFGEASPATASLRSVVAQNQPDYAIVQSFPTGTFRDTAPNKPPLRWAFAPHTLRVRDGETLDVSLVVRRAQVHNLGGAGQLVGLADFALTLGLTENTVSYTKR